MRLGGPIFRETKNFTEAIEIHRKLGFGAAFATYIEDKIERKEFVAAFSEADIVLAEFGSYCINILDTDQNLFFITAVKGAVWCNAGMLQAVILRCEAAMVMLQIGYIHPVDSGLKQRNIDNSALSVRVALSGKQCLQYLLISCHSCRDIRDRYAHPGQLITGAGNTAKSGLRLDQ